MDMTIRVPNPITPEQVAKFHTELAKLPQMDVRTEHYFANGMYCRKCYLPAGTLFVGKIQKPEHFFILAAGYIAVWYEGGMIEMVEGDVFVGSPGAKRIGIAWEDSVAIGVYRTDKRDIAEIEREIIAPDELPVFYNALNELLPHALTEGAK